MDAHADPSGRGISSFRPGAVGIPDVFQNVMSNLSAFVLLSAGFQPGAYDMASAATNASGRRTVSCICAIQSNGVSGLTERRLHVFTSEAMERRLRSGKLYYRKR